MTDTKDASTSLGAASWIGAHEHKAGGDLHMRAITFFNNVRWNILFSLAAGIHGRAGIPYR